MIAEARHLVDAPAGSGLALAWHAGRWLLALGLALAPLWVGPWHGAPRHAGPPPLELAIVRLPPAAPGKGAGAETPPPATAEPAADSAPPEDGVSPAPDAPPTVETPVTPEPVPSTAAAPAPPPPQVPRVPEATRPAEHVPPVVSTRPAESAQLPAEAPPEQAAPNRPQGAAASAPQPTAPPSPEQPVDAEALDAGFRLLSRGTLTYPSRARRLSRGGEVRVEVAVDPTGHVTGVTVLHETRGWGFGDAAREAYAQARFTPPTVNGRPVHVRWRKTLRFQP